MVSTQHILRFIDADSEVRRPPLVGMQFLHEPRVEAGLRRAQSSHKARGLIGFLVGQLAGSRETPPRCSVAVPRCSVAVRVFTPSGVAAVKVRAR
jgi:hypothetical protein